VIKLIKLLFAQSTATKFGTVTRGRVACFRGPATPLSRGPLPQISRPSTCVHTVLETKQPNIACMVIKMDARQIFTWSTTNADARSVCGS